MKKYKLGQSHIFPLAKYEEANCAMIARETVRWLEFWYELYNECDDVDEYARLVPDVECPADLEFTSWLLEVGIDSASWVRAHAILALTPKV